MAHDLRVAKNRYFWRYLRVMVTAALADLLGSAALIAFTVTFSGSGAAAGAL